MCALLSQRPATEENQVEMEEKIFSLLTTGPVLPEPEPFIPTASVWVNTSFWHTHKKET